MDFTPEIIAKLRAEEKELIELMKGSIIELQKAIDNNFFANDEKRQSAIKLKNQTEEHLKKLEADPW